jgi:hypothetical protein
MDADDREESEFRKFIIPVALIKALSEVMLSVIDGWYQEQGDEDLDIAYCQAVMLAATAQSIEALTFGECNGTLQ